MFQNFNYRIYKILQNNIILCASNEVKRQSIKCLLSKIAAKAMIQNRTFLLIAVLEPVLVFLLLVHFPVQPRVNQIFIKIKRIKKLENSQIIVEFSLDCHVLFILRGYQFLFLAQNVSLVSRLVCCWYILLVFLSVLVFPRQLENNNCKYLLIVLY